MKKRCPACGIFFECSHDIHCWCMSVTIADAIRKELEKRYNDCLCKGCLEQLEESVKKNLVK